MELQKKAFPLTGATFPPHGGTPSATYHPHWLVGGGDTMACLHSGTP